MIIRWDVSNGLVARGLLTTLLALASAGCVMEGAEIDGAGAALVTEDAIVADRVSDAEGVDIVASAEGAEDPRREAAGAAIGETGVEIDHCVDGDTRNEKLAIKLSIHDQPLTEDDREALLGMLAILGTAAELIEIGSTMLEAVGVDVPGVGFVDPSTVFDAAAVAARASLRASYYHEAFANGWRVIAIARWEVCREGAWVQDQRVFDVQRPARRWVVILHADDRLRWRHDAFSSDNAEDALKDAVTEVATQLGWLAPPR
ncbi:MAG: hypothetical protein IT379_18250 [Deltaproteobacteria bacterium]|nr:hypothetical protein [Deltaproteobacteria bacterium]